jgi:hypothetical protein
MQFTQTTILGFFDSSQKSYEIPVYQRAYSWTKPNWTTFLEDLLEQLEGDNSYFYGNILLETIKKNRKYEIIDGQQRITTLTIFIRSLLNILESRSDEEILNDFDFKEKIKIYIKNNGNIKLRPVEYDRACYDSLIVDNNSKFQINTPSQKKILEAKNFFENGLNNLSTDKILELLEKIEDTELTLIELDNKKDSALMFELENNRGKDLTNMEKIKSYFMYQMYVYSKEDDTEINIENISNIFKLIYLIINDLQHLKEDAILIYHNNAYINGFTYRTLEDVKKEFKKSENKIEWIKNYIAELYTTFSNMKKFEQSKSIYAIHLNNLEIPAFVYPFIIKGYKYFGDDTDKLNELFHILEIITFRAKLINSRANIQDRLNKILMDFNGDVDKLRVNIKDKLNESWYWGDNNTENYLYGGLYGNKILNYLLWRYEDSIQNKGYNVQNFKIKNEQIEHISPKKPTNGEALETGYDVDENNEYSEEFISDYLHCIGNLMLISGSHNASIGNKAFKEKLETYNQNPLLNQQAEIKDFAVQEKNQFVWKKESIDKRQKTIVDFAINVWSF